MSPHQKHATGFSLIELVIAIALLGLLTGSLILNYSRTTNRQKIKQELANFKETLRLVQSTAKTGEKDGCGSDTLYGWQVTFAQPAGAQPALLIYAVACPGRTDIRGSSAKIVKLKPGITYAPLPASFFFRPLTMPVTQSNGAAMISPLDLKLTDGVNTCTLTIAPNGEMSEGGCTP